MFIEIGAFDAKARLSKLLQEVQQGQRFTITLRGRPVADLVPSGESAGDVHGAIEAMRQLPRVQGIADETVLEWIAEGRR